MDKGIKIVFMGTPDFAVSCLKEIVESNFNVVGVVTSVDKPAGRGKKLRSSPIKQYAIENNIPVLQPKNLKADDFISELKALGADLFVVVAFRMLPEVVWTMPEKGTINLHASLLPNYRGAAPINWAIINGEKESGVSTFFIEKEIDTGKVIFQDRVRILDEMTAGELHDLLANVGARLMCKTIREIESDNVKAIAQNTDGIEIKKAPKIFKADCQLNWTESYLNIYNKVRGLSPYPAAWSILKTEKELSIKFMKADYEPCEHQLKPGQIETDNKNYFKIACKDGFIIPIEIIPQGKSKMNLKAFLNGNKLNEKATFV